MVNEGIELFAWRTAAASVTTSATTLTAPTRCAYLATASRSGGRATSPYQSRRRGSGRGAVGCIRPRPASLWSFDLRHHSLPIYPRRVHDDADASPLQAYADHAAFLADVRDGRVPAAFRPDARPVRVRLEVEDYLPSAYRDVHAYLDPFRRAQNGEPPLAKPETLSSEGRSSRLKRFDKS